MQKRHNKEEFSQIKQVADRARPVAVPNEQIKQRSNFESSAKLLFTISKNSLFRDEICTDTDVSSTLSSQSSNAVYNEFTIINRI